MEHSLKEYKGWIVSELRRGKNTINVTRLRISSICFFHSMLAENEPGIDNQASIQLSTSDGCSILIIYKKDEIEKYHQDLAFLNSLIYK